MIEVLHGRFKHEYGSITIEILTSQLENEF